MTASPRHIVTRARHVRVVETVWRSWRRCCSKALASAGVFTSLCIAVGGVGEVCERVATLRARSSSTRTRGDNPPSVARNTSFSAAGRLARQLPWAAIFAPRHYRTFVGGSSTLAQRQVLTVNTLECRQRGAAWIAKQYPQKQRAGSHGSRAVVPVARQDTQHCMFPAVVAHYMSAYKFK